MIRIENLHMRYRTERGEVYAVRDINRLVEQRQFYTLLGPSGCGKTSTLRCVAGLARDARFRVGKLSSRRRQSNL